MEVIWIILIIVVFMILLGVGIFLAIYFGTRNQGGSSFSLPAVKNVKTAFATNNGAFADGWGSFSPGEQGGCSIATTSNSIGFILTNNSSITVAMNLDFVYPGNFTSGMPNNTCTGNITTWPSNIIVEPNESRKWDDQAIVPNVYFTLYNECQFQVNNVIANLNSMNPLTQYADITYNADNTITIVVKQS